MSRRGCRLGFIATRLPELDCNPDCVGGNECFTRPASSKWMSDRSSHSIRLRRSFKDIEDLRRTVLLVAALPGDFRQYALVY